MEHHIDNGGDTEEHDDTLYEIIDGCCLVSSEDDIDSGKGSHYHGAI